ncbi:hypothetical protein ACPPVW_18375 [Leifsonia sp. McL0607]|uniref:hypothetical protein n=1 Tax=Leifsonia sp. McL0607 TaxID=3415672 RepID=UPI003CFA93F3
MRALESDFAPAVKSLVETLGKGLVAVIVDRDVKTVSRWMSGDTPRDEEQCRVRDTLQICELLLSGDSPSVVRSWFLGMNPQLNDENPAEVLADGRARDVMAAARAYVNAS